MGKNRVAVFDVDGTLYNQKKLRLAMAVRLLCYYLIHPTQYRELRALLAYRHIREEARYADAGDEERIAAAACIAGCEPGALQVCIRKWMFQVPLDLIVKYRNRNVLRYLDSLRGQGYAIAIYSDYPVEEKLETLGVTADWIFYPGHSPFHALKPSREAMEYIVKQTGADAASSVYVGDREEKDGISARMVGMKYVDAKRFHFPE